MNLICVFLRLHCKCPWQVRGGSCDHREFVFGGHSGRLARRWKFFTGLTPKEGTVHHVGCEKLFGLFCRTLNFACFVCSTTEGAV